MYSKFYRSLAIVFLVFASQLQAAESKWTKITVKKMHCAGCAKKISARIYAVRGVKEVRMDIKKKTLYVHPQRKAVLSPLAMWEAVEKAKDVPIRITGPSGTFTKKPKS